MATKKLQFLKDEEGKLTSPLMIYMPPELKELVGRKADEVNLAMSEWIVKVLAEKLDRKDLGVVPRKRPGRKRKVLVA